MVSRTHMDFLLQKTPFFRLPQVQVGCWLEAFQFHSCNCSVDLYTHRHTHTDAVWGNGLLCRFAYWKVLLFCHPFIVGLRLETTVGGKTTIVKFRHTASHQQQVRGMVGTLSWKVFFLILLTFASLEPIGHIPHVSQSLSSCPGPCGRMRAHRTRAACARALNSVSFPAHTEVHTGVHLRCRRGNSAGGSKKRISRWCRLIMILRSWRMCAAAAAATLIHIRASGCCALGFCLQTAQEV